MGLAAILARYVPAVRDAFVAPIVLGSGKTGLNLSPIETLDQAMRPMVRTMRFRDGDMLCICDLTAPAGTPGSAEDKRCRAIR